MKYKFLVVVEVIFIIMLVMVVIDEGIIDRGNISSDVLDLLSLIISTAIALITMHLADKKVDADDAIIVSVYGIFLTIHGTPILALYIFATTTATHIRKLAYELRHKE